MRYLISLLFWFVYSNAVAQNPNNVNGSYVKPLPPVKTITTAPDYKAPEPQATKPATTYGNSNASSSPTPAATSSASTATKPSLSKQELKETLVWLKEYDRKQMENIKRIQKEVKDRYKKFEKENTTTSNVAISSFEEHFDSLSKFTWPATYRATIKGGVYELSVPIGGDYQYKVPFPPSFLFSEKDDWQLDVNINEVIGNATTWWGVTIGYIGEKDAACMINSSSNLSDGKSVHVKKHFNKLTLMRKGNIFAEYLNDKLFYVGVIDAWNIKAGKFFLTATDPGKGYQHLMLYDDIKFSILAKQ